MEYAPETVHSFTGKELDAETGYSYFGARYYDPATLAAWLSVDPMSDKYPSISPYAYCAWNPLKLVDPNGKDWLVIFDHENKTVTIEAKYAANKEAKESAENAIKAWNDLSGIYSLMVDKEKYVVNFDLSVIGEQDFDPQEPSHNFYSLASDLKNNDGIIDDNICGQTKTKFIKVRESEMDNYVTSSHEIGHTLGLLHSENDIKGLMEPDGGRKSGHHEITKNNVMSIINLSLHPEKRDATYNSGFGFYREVGGINDNITKPHKIGLIKN